MRKCLLAAAALLWPFAAHAVGPGNESEPKCLSLEAWLALAAKVDQPESSLGHIATNHRRVVLTYGTGDQWAVLMEVDAAKNRWCLLAEN